MMINGKNVHTFYDSHSIGQIDTVVQTLQAFGLHRELELYLKNKIHRREFKAKPFVPPDPLEKRLQLLPQQCPKCGNRLRGTNRVGCAGRKWYEECTICDYYREEFGGNDAVALRR